MTPSFAKMTNAIYQRSPAQKPNDAFGDDLSNEGSDEGNFSETGEPAAFSPAAWTKQPVALTNITFIGRPGNIRSSSSSKDVSQPIAHRPQPQRPQPIRLQPPQGNVSQASQSGKLSKVNSTLSTDSNSNPFDPSMLRISPSENQQRKVTKATSGKIRPAGTAFRKALSKNPPTLLQKQSSENKIRALNVQPLRPVSFLAASTSNGLVSSAIYSTATTGVSSVGTPTTPKFLGSDNQRLADRGCEKGAVRRRERVGDRDEWRGEREGDRGAKRGGDRRTARNSVVIAERNRVPRSSSVKGGLTRTLSNIVRRPSFRTNRAKSTRDSESAVNISKITDGAGTSNCGQEELISLYSSQKASVPRFRDISATPLQSKPPEHLSQAQLNTRKMLSHQGGMNADFQFGPVNSTRSTTSNVSHASKDRDESIAPYSLSLSPLTADSSVFDMITPSSSLYAPSPKKSYHPSASDIFTNGMGKIELHSIVSKSSTVNSHGGQRVEEFGNGPLNRQRTGLSQFESAISNSASRLKSMPLKHPISSCSSRKTALRSSAPLSAKCDASLRLLPEGLNIVEPESAQEEVLDNYSIADSRYAKSRTTSQLLDGHLNGAQPLSPGLTHSSPFKIGGKRLRLKLVGRGKLAEKTGSTSFGNGKNS